MIADLSCSVDWKEKLRCWLNEEGQAIRSPVDFAVVASGGRYKPAAHHNLLNEYLLKVASGDIRRLMICMPPRHGKSHLTSEFFPAWYLGKNPEKNVILSSYESDFAASWGRKVRTLIEEHGQTLFLKSINTRKDSRAANRWEIRKFGGGMYTAGAGGALTGRGAELIIIDDLFKNAEEAASLTIRNKVWDWYQSTLLTRLHPGGSIILINTRWHTDDLSGRLLAQEADEWTVINLPAIAEENDALGRQPGDPLWPEWYSLETLYEIKHSITSYFWNALYQQHPFDKSGGLFQPEWFKIIDDYPKDCRMVRFWDFAASEGRGDYSSGALVGVKNGMCYIIDIDRFQGSPATVENRLVLAATTDGKEVPVRWEEEPGSSGKHMSDHLTRNVLFGWSASGIRSTGSKEIRALPLSSLAEMGNVYLVRGLWNKAFLDEAQVFPMGEHDDQVDSVCGGFNFVAGGSGDIGVITRNPFAGKYAGDGISDPRRNRYR